MGKAIGICYNCDREDTVKSRRHSGMVIRNELIVDTAFAVSHKKLKERLEEKVGKSIVFANDMEPDELTSFLQTLLRSWGKRVKWLRKMYRELRKQQEPDHDDS